MKPQYTVTNKNDDTILVILWNGALLLLKTGESVSGEVYAIQRSCTQESPLVVPLAVEQRLLAP